MRKYIYSALLISKSIFVDFQEQNPFVDQDLENILRMIMVPSTNSTLKNNKLSFKYNEGVPFKFSWNLTKDSDEVFFEQITTSLINSMAIMEEQNKELKTVIQNKDAEIEQYKLEGVKLVRKNLETKIFNESEFDETFQKGDFVEFMKSFVKVEENSNITKKTPVKELSTSSKISPSVKQKVLSRKFQPNEASKPIVYDDEEHSQPKEITIEPETIPEIAKKKPKIRRDLNL